MHDVNKDGSKLQRVEWKSADVCSSVFYLFFILFNKKNNNLFLFFRFYVVCVFFFWFNKTVRMLGTATKFVDGKKNYHKTLISIQITVLIFFFCIFFFFFKCWRRKWTQKRKPKCCSTKPRKPRKRKRNRVWQSRIRRATHTIATRRQMMMMPTTSPSNTRACIARAVDSPLFVCVCVCVGKKRHRRRRKPSPQPATATTTPIPMLHRLTNPMIAGTNTRLPCHSFAQVICRLKIVLRKRNQNRKKRKQRKR